MHYFNPWYQSEEGQFFLRATNDGQLMFVWEATFRNGHTVRMYEDLAFERCLIDPDYVPPVDLRRSTDLLDRDKVRGFMLYPIALTKKVHPKCEIIGVKIDLSIGERFVHHWLTDYVPKTGRYLRRTVVGVERSPKDSRERFDLYVVSPSGAIMKTPTEDISFEGE